MRLIPGALRLVKVGNPLDWRRAGAQAFIAEVMDVLNRSLHLVERRRLRNGIAGGLSIGLLVARLRLAQHVYQWVDRNRQLARVG